MQIKIWLVPDYLMEIFIQIKIKIMNLIKIIKTSFFVSFLLLSCGFICSQNTYNGPIYISNKDYFDEKMDSIVSKDYYELPDKDVEIIFTFKIDSIGEVLSAHIRKSDNLNSKYHYNICYLIESMFLVKFLYDEYKYQLIDPKYVFVTYVYDSGRKKGF
jgi:hypothetical protein